MALRFHNVVNGVHEVGDHSGATTSGDSGGGGSSAFPPASQLQTGDVVYWDADTQTWRRAEGTRQPGYVLALDSEMRLRWTDIGIVVDSAPPPPPPPAGDVTAPATPTGLTRVPGDRQVLLNWDDNGEGDLAFYNVYWAADSGGPFVLKQGAVQASALTVTGLTNGTAYWFTVSAEDTSGNESAQSASVTTTPIPPDPADVTAPSVPTGLGATAGDRSIVLNWDDSAATDFASFKVYRSTTSGGTYALVSTRTVSNFTNTGLTNGQTYYYKVSAVDQTGNESAQSSSANATPVAPVDTTPPPIPSGVTATGQAGAVALNWSDSPASDFSVFKVYRGTVPGGPYTVVATPTASNYTNSGLVNGTTYYFRITAVDTAGNESANSIEVSATPSVPVTGTYGASGYGTSAEAATTTGTQVSSLGAITASSTVYLLNAGTYTGNLTIPANSTVKPYNGGVVQINGTVSFSNGSTIAGIHVQQTSSIGWASQITSRTGVTIRNCKYRGGKHEAIRIDGSSNNILITGCDIDGGFENHTVKVYGQGGTPTNITFRNCYFTKTHFGGGEDLLQLEFYGTVYVDQCTFTNNATGEDGLDTKEGQVLRVTNCLFPGGINSENMLISGDYYQDVLIENNKFVGDFSSLGSHPEAMRLPKWVWRNNLMQNGTLRLRRSKDAQHYNNRFENSTIQVGVYDNQDDYPRDPVFQGNVYVNCSHQVQHATGLVKDW